MRRTILLLALLLLALPVSVFAQDTLAVDELKSGMIGAGNEPQLFQVSIPLAGTYEIVVAEIVPGLAPQFVVLSGLGAPVATVSNTTGASSVTQTIEFTQAGQYILSVDSATGATGRFVIQLRVGGESTAPTLLSVGQTLTPTLASGQDQRFSFSADPQNTLMLTVSGQVSIELTDSNGTAYAQFSSLLAGGSINVPPGATSFILIITNDTQPAPVEVSIMLALGPASGETTDSSSSDGEVVATLPPGEAVQPQPVLPSTGECVLATLQVVSVNVRRTPTTSSPNVIGSLSPYETYRVVGRVSDNSWYEVIAGGVRGWVAASVTRRGGNCANVSITYTYPTPTYTYTPMSTMSPTPTATATSLLSATPTPTYTATTLASPTPTYTYTYTYTPSHTYTPTPSPTPSS